jgi:hypothetical protein
MMIHIWCLSFFNLKVCVFFMCLCLCLCVSFFHFFNLNVCVCFMCLCLCLFVSFIFLFIRVFVCVFVDVSVSFNLTHIKDSNSIRGFINVVFQLLTVSVLWALFIEKGGAIQLFDHKNIKEKSLTLRFFDITFRFYITLHKSTFSEYI